MINIQVLFFASAREAAGGVGQMVLSVPDCCDTNQLRQVLASNYPGLAQMVLDEESITLALNEEYVAAGRDLDRALTSAGIIRK